ncbi:hypothetical protein P3S67_020015 [Capsicum chacoense]|uniref:uncharacterized protein LOC124886715 n=1 Tax=Capsicum annuum TaxID=4072 RepID=UPI001FB07CF4|nr:uncharacterized protein LOC124886715 [Capsicum annuum]
MWVMAGYFNDIRDNLEKIGGRILDESSFTDFKNFLWEIGAIDLGFNGKPWTWWCYRENDGIIQERLDRALCSPGWRLQFNQANINHLETEASDHSALLINSEPSPIKRKKRFFFDKRWSEIKEVNIAIEQTWNRSVEGNKQSIVNFKLKRCKLALLAWLRDGKGNSREKIQGIKNRIVDLKNDIRPFDITNMKELKKELGKAYKDGEIY